MDSGHQQRVQWKSLWLQNSSRPKAIFTVWLQLQIKLNTTDRLKNSSGLVQVATIDPICLSSLQYLGPICLGSHRLCLGEKSNCPNL
ncbi:hypothetical protein H5410_002519 [Solanum commersonii]|uniref:Reverse transcriptase zinc-binding domain-containing protein n=1 Tax=Solanum commersonii TaxID=4109 RepID=A0A9J6B2I8_SOLCO|nr:hypothetical protein H5410_002519 [Solanum commersonii]